MTTLTEEKIAHTFPDGWEVTKYDSWPFYQNRFKDSCCGNKAVDFLAYDPVEHTLWMIELKDYRVFRRTKDIKISLPDEVAIKARDTLAGLVAAKTDTTHEEQQRAAQMMHATRIRVVLHLEQPKTPSKLYPRAYDPASVQQKLKQLVKPIDAHPRIMEFSRMGGVPWQAASVGDTTTRSARSRRSSGGGGG